MKSTTKQVLAINLNKQIERILNNEVFVTKEIVDTNLKTLIYPKTTVMITAFNITELHPECIRIDMNFKDFSSNENECSLHFESNDHTERFCEDCLITR